MASDSTAGGAPAEKPVDPDAPLETDAADVARLIEQLQAEKAELHDKYLRAEAETHIARKAAGYNMASESVDGMDVVFVGPADLSASMGGAIGFDAPALRPLIAAISPTSPRVIS